MSGTLEPIGLQQLPDAQLPLQPGDLFAVQRDASPLAAVDLTDLTNAIFGTVATPGVYTKVQVNAFGQVTFGSSINAADVTGALTYTPVNPVVIGQPNGIASLDGTGVLTSSQIPPSLLSGLFPQGTWNASTNTPTLHSSLGTNGYFYVVAVAGSANLDGNSTWNIGDWALFSGGIWHRVPSATVLGTMAVQNANSIAVTGGALAGVTVDTTSVLNVRAINNNGTVSQTAAQWISQELNGASFGLVPDEIVLFGTISWSGTTVTFSGATGGTLDASFDGKVMLLPAGADDGSGNSAPAVVTITDASAWPVVQVSATASHPFSNVAWYVGQEGADAPSAISIVSAGTSAAVGQVLTLTGGAVALAPTVQVLQTTCVAVSAVSNGTGGPLSSPVYLRQVHGHGYPVTVLGTTDSNGSLDPSSLSIFNPGTVWQDETNYAAVQFAVNPTPHTIGTPNGASWSPGSGTITFNSNIPAVLLADIHVGANVVANSDTSGVIGISNAIVQSVSGTIVVVSPPAVGGGTNQQVVITDNQVAVSISGASFSANSATILVSGSIPSYLAPGAGLAGLGLPGNGDPSQPTGNAIIQTVSPGTIVLTGAVTTAAVSGATLTAYPYLTGVTLALSMGAAALAYKEHGALSSLPAGNQYTAPNGVVVVAGAGTMDIPIGTDSTAAFNAAFAAARAIATAAHEPTDGAVLLRIPPGQYLALSQIDAWNMRGTGIEIVASSVRIRSAAKGLLALDQTRCFNTVWRGPFRLWGDRRFPPLWGQLSGMIGGTGSGVAANQRFYDWCIDGFYQRFARVDRNNENNTLFGCQTINRYPPPGPPTSNANLGGARAIDGLNLLGCSSSHGNPPSPSNLGSFNGFQEINSPALSQGGIPFFVTGTTDWRASNLYAAAYCGAAIWLCTGGAGYAGVSGTQISGDWEQNITSHPGVQELIFVFTTGNPSSGFDIDLRGTDLEIGNALLSYDVEGNFGAGGVQALSVIGRGFDIGFNTTQARFFDRPTSVRSGGINLGVFSVILNGALGTAAQHWNGSSWNIHLLGSQMFNKDVLNITATSVIAGTIVATSLLIDDGGLQVLGAATAQQFSVTTGSGQPITAALSPGAMTIGTRGTTAAPSTLPALINIYADGNTSGMIDARLAALNQGGTLLVQGPNGAAVKANLQVQGNSLAFSRSLPPRYVTTADGGGTLTNGSTISMIGTINADGSVQFDSDVIIDVTGTLSNLVLNFPTETNLYDGHEVIWRARGVLNSPTLVSPGTVTIVGAPGTITSGTPYKAKYLRGAAQWQPN